VIFTIKTDDFFKYQYIIKCYLEIIGSNILEVKVQEQETEKNCVDNTEEVTKEIDNDDEIETEDFEKQWVSKVMEFSSEFNKNSWSADQIIGEPKVYPKYGDLEGTWAQSEFNPYQFIVLKYENPVYPTKIKIYETYHSYCVIDAVGRFGFKII
jgi:hypothetical protein